MIRILLILLAISCTQTPAEIETAQQVARKHNEEQTNNCRNKCWSYGLPFRGIEFAQTSNIDAYRYETFICKCGY